MIEIANPTTQPALTFNQIFLVSFLLRQDVTGKKNVEIVVRPAATAPDGSTVFGSGPQTIQIEDFDAWATGQMLTPLQTTEAVGAAYATAKTAANAATLLDVMAVFQAGIARICEANGVYQVQAVA